MLHSTCSSDLVSYHSQYSERWRFKEVDEPLGDAKFLGENGLHAYCVLFGDDLFEEEVPDEEPGLSRPSHPEPVSSLSHLHSTDP